MIGPYKLEKTMIYIFGCLPLQCKSLGSTKNM